MRIDIFNLEENLAGPAIDHVWILGWVTIVTQLLIIMNREQLMPAN
jgi:hypothetical protein